MNKLTLHQILMMHERIIQKTGGSQGIRDEGLLEAALAAPFASFSGQEIYKSLEEKVARLGYGIIKNHAMIDGNKRLAVHCMEMFLLINQVRLSYDLEAAEKIVLDVATNQASEHDLYEWVIRHEEHIKA